MASVSQSQTNAVPSSSAAGPSQSASQPTQNTATSGSTTVQNTQTTNTSMGAAGTGASAAGSSNSNNAQAGGAPQQQPTPSSPSPTHAPRPRDARTIELLLTSQGVTSFDQRVPLLLLDFAYRHTSSVLSDALHLSTDPYTTHAGSKPSASSGAAPSAPSAGEAVVTTNAINLAIASRQSFQFRGGSAGGVSGASKEWMQEVARDRNKIALPRVLANEWGVRLPNERFVLSGMGWSLRDQWMVDQEDDGDDSDEDEEMEEVDTQKQSAANATAGEEGGGLEELLGDDMGEMGDEDMEGME